MSRHLSGANLPLPSDAEFPYLVLKGADDPRYPNTMRLSQMSATEIDKILNRATYNGDDERAKGLIEEAKNSLSKYKRKARENKAMRTNTNAGEKDHRETSADLFCQALRLNPSFSKKGLNLCEKYRPDELVHQISLDVDLAGAFIQQGKHSHPQKASNFYSQALKHAEQGLEKNARLQGANGYEQLLLRRRDDAKELKDHAERAMQDRALQSEFDRKLEIAHQLRISQPETTLKIYDEMIKTLHSIPVPERLSWHHKTADWLYREFTMLSASLNA
jgi:hypothetical protein